MQNLNKWKNQILQNIKQEIAKHDHFQEKTYKI
jgi:hypothetical protein